MEYKKIKKEQLIVDNLYKIRQYKPNNQLLQQFTKEIINPLLVFSADAHFLLIDGFRRVEFGNVNEFQVVVYDNLRDCFVKSLEINMITSQFTEIEKGFAIYIAFNQIGMTKEEIINQVNPILGLAKKMEILNNFLSIFNLSGDLFKCLLEKKAPISLFLRFLLESKENQNILFNLFETKKLSLSQIRNIYDLLFYIRKREGVDFLNIIKEADESNDFEKHLVKKRYPVFFGLKNDLENLKKDYKPFIDFPEDFEDTAISFKTNLKSVEDIEKSEEVLKKLKDDIRFKEFTDNL